MFAKMFSSITESSLWSEPKEVRLLFVTMLAKADSCGFIEASVPGLARVANLTIEETVTSLEVLQSPDTYSKNPDNEGRRILSVVGGFMLLNYEDYRARRNSEERREYMREYMSNYRKQSANKLAKSNRSKSQLAQAETETETETETEAKTKTKTTIEFDSFWAVYPRKVAVGKARIAWAKAIKSANPELIIAGAVKLAAAKRDPKYTPHASTWLNAQQWSDEEWQTVSATNDAGHPIDDWDEVQQIVHDVYHPDLKNWAQVEKLLTPQQYAAVAIAGFLSVCDCNQWDKKTPAAYRKARASNGC